MAGDMEAPGSGEQVAQQQHGAEDRPDPRRSVLLRALPQQKQQRDGRSENRGIEGETAPLEVAVIGAKARFREESQSSQQIIQTDRGEYELRLKVVEQDMDMMRLSLSLPTRELADQLAQRWPQKAGKIYETVIRILSEDEA